MEPGWAVRNRGAEGSQGAFMTRSREAELARCLCKIYKTINTGNGTSSASVAMCEAFLDTCVAYSREWLIPHVGLMKAGACERSEVRAGITKVREDFLIRSFMTAHRLGNRHTRL
jgi:hypothetical protein